MVVAVPQKAIVRPTMIPTLLRFCVFILLHFYELFKSIFAKNFHLSQFLLFFHILAVICYRFLYISKFQYFRISFFSHAL